MDLITALFGFIYLYIFLALAQLANWLINLFADLQANWAAVLIWGLAAPLCAIAVLHIRKKIRRSDTVPNTIPDPHITKGIKVCAGILLLYCLYEAYALINTLHLLARNNLLDLNWQPWDYLPMAVQLALLTAGAIALLRLKPQAVTLFSAAAFLYLLSLAHGLISHPVYLNQLGIILLFGMVKIGLPLSLSIYASWRKIAPAQ
jgi:hypothetical protein